MGERIIGILGGMGPLASLELYRRLIDLVDAERDQDHPRIVIDSNSKVPDRTEAALHGGEDPLPALLDSARLLERAGCGVLAIACNTAHLHHAAISAAVDVPVVHMLAETAAAVGPGHAPLGVLATDATAALGLYQQALGEAGLEAFVPDDDAQRATMAAISHVKAGRRDAALPLAREAAGHLAGRGARAVVLGCTELSVLLPDHDVGLPQFDPLSVLAEATLRLALPGWSPTATRTDRGASE